MRQIDNMSESELDTLRLKNMLPERKPDNKARFTCACGGKTIVESETSVLHDCKAQQGCKVFEPLTGFVRRVRVQINPELTGGVERYNWFVDWRSQ